MKKTISAEEKARIALEAVQEMKSSSQIASAHEVHPIQVGIWKKELVTRAHTLFDNTKKGKTAVEEQAALIQKLYTIIGEREADLTWLKKKLHLESR